MVDSLVFSVIYIYIERERQRERDREIETESMVKWLMVFSIFASAKEIY